MSYSGSLSPFVVAFDDVIGGSFNNYLKLSSTIGGVLKQHSDMVSKAVAGQREFLIKASNSRQPNDRDLMDLLRPLSDQIQLIQDFRSKNRTHELFNHLSAISESISALGWVTIAPTPGPYVKEMSDASQFYTNKVLVSYKDKNKTHIEWAKAWLAFLSELQSYIKQYHTTGLSWNTKGGELSSNLSGGGAPLPPPPPPPAGFFDDGKPDDGRGALFAQINRGTDITKGLRKIAIDQQTHKNPALRTSGPTPYKAPTIVTQTAAAAVVVATAPVKLPPKFALEGKKWMIENQIGQKSLVINNAEMNQSINVYKCEDCVLQVKGKVNSITVDLSKKFSIIFDNIVSVVEFINCQRIQAQATGAVPTITIDKTDGAEIYLAKESLAVEIVSSKSSSINISVPDSRTGDYVEHPIPEQFKTIWKGKGFYTEPVKKD